MAYPTQRGIQGMDLLIGKLDRLAALMHPEALTAKTLDDAEKIGNLMATTARELAPVGKRPDGDRIIDGITVERVGNAVEVRSRSKHSLYVEFGTSKMPAQPFFRPAYYQYRYFEFVAKNRQQEILEAIGS